MAYTGKIAFHFPNRSPNPNFDTNDIKFLPAGITNPTSNDLVQVNKVYAIPAGVTVTLANLQNYVVWEKAHEYIALNNSETILFKWTAPTGVTTIDSATIWLDAPNEHGKYMTVWTESNNELTCIAKLETGNFSTTSFTNDSLTVNGQTVTVKKFAVTINSASRVSVTPGNTYYIYLDCATHQYPGSKNYAYEDIQGEYKINKGEYYRIVNGVGTQILNYQTVTTNKIKAEINGVSI